MDIDGISIDGVTVAGGSVGIKATGKPDLALLAFPDGANWAATTTRNQLKAAPVRRLEKMRAAKPRLPLKLIVANSGCANACTGPEGDKGVEATLRAAAMHAGCERDEIAVASTGVIGVPLPAMKIRANIKKVLDVLRPNGWAAAAEAIRTTDNAPKACFRDVVGADGQPLGKVGGIAKGAGMIGPNMATMLCFLATDMTFDNEQLDEMLKLAVAQSFNRVMVDDDQSTNDTLILAATCKRQVAAADVAARFQAALNEVTRDLALKLVYDGEGAKRIAAIFVEGALSDADADKIARAIGRSPLFKTALYGADPNWGRIAAAAGNAGVAMIEDTLTIAIGEHTVFNRGENLMDKALELKVAAVMKAQTVPIYVKVGRGSGRAELWSSDLGYEYIKINADYRS